MRARITILTFLMTLAGTGAPAVGQVSCDPSNDCYTGAVCQPDGTCKGVPKTSGTACDARVSTGGCATSGECFTFGDTSFCMPMDIQPAGTPCTPVGLEVLGACILGGECREGGFCEPQIKECQQPEDKCTRAYCDPSDGQCRTIPTCDLFCSVGTCDPSTGACSNAQPANENQVCGSGSVCLENFRCQNGLCRASTGPPPPSATPTNTPTSTRTPTVTPPTGASPCVGDCGGNQTVVVTNIITLVNIVLGSLPQSACTNGIPPGAQVNVTLIIQAVNNVLMGCTHPPA